MENKVINKYPNNKIKLKYLASAFSSNHKQSDVKAEGRYPVFGASGLVGFLDIFDQNQKYIGIIKDGAGVGRSKVYEKETSILSTMTYIVPKDEKKADIAFLNYSLLAMDLGSSLDKATIPHIYFSAYGNKFVWDISLCHQKKIVSFLNRKCLIIDSLIFNETKQIEKLEEYKKAVITKAVTKGLDPDAKMKDSDVEWIGEIPENWSTIRIKNTSWLKGRIGWDGLKSSEFIDSGPYLITGTDFSNGSINWKTCAHISEERYLQDELLHIKENDLLITKDGTIGKLAIVKNCPEKVSLNSGVMIVRNDTVFKYSNRYLYYVLQSNQFFLWYELSQSGNSTIKHLYQAQFYNFEFSYPSLNEQSNIANYLDGRCSKIDLLLDSFEQKISKLKAYKQSLIYEYVTGKKRVSL